MNSLNKNFTYWILPTLIIGVCMAIYFFDIFGLSYAISPNYNREFGLLENIQLLIIGVILYYSFKQFYRAETNTSKYIIGIIIVGSLFIFLEEMDYGLHYFDYFSGKSADQLKMEAQSKEQVRNIHNQGNITGLIKYLAYISLALLALSPLLLPKLKEDSKLRYLIPNHHYFIYSLIAMVGLNQIALYIDRNFKSLGVNSLDYNVSEFEETFIYYFILLYFFEKLNMLLNIEKHHFTVPQFTVFRKIA